MLKLSSGKRVMEEITCGKRSNHIICHGMDKKLGVIVVKAVNFDMLILEGDFKLSK